MQREVETAARHHDADALERLAEELSGGAVGGTERERSVLRLWTIFHEANVLRHRRQVEDHPKSSEFQDHQVEIADGAETIARELLKATPDDPELLVLLGELIALQITGPNGALIGPEAGDLVERAIQLDPDNAIAELAAGRRYLYTPGAFGGSDSEALLHLERAEKIVNDRERALVAKLRENKLRDGMPADEKRRVAREIATQARQQAWHMHEEILVQLAIAYERGGRLRRARLALRRALAANPDCDSAKALLARLGEG